MGGVDISRRRAACQCPPPPSMAAMGPDWYQSGPGLVIDFCTSPGRTGNSTYRLTWSCTIHLVNCNSYIFVAISCRVIFTPLGWTVCSRCMSWQPSTLVSCWTVVIIVGLWTDSPIVFCLYSNLVTLYYMLYAHYYGLPIVYGLVHLTYDFSLRQYILIVC